MRIRGRWLKEGGGGRRERMREEGERSRTGRGVGRGGGGGLGRGKLEEHRGIGKDGRTGGREGRRVLGTG